MNDPIPNQEVPTGKKLKLENNFHSLWFLLIVVIVAIIGFSVLKTTWQQMNRSKYYQAVHLTNGQLFFGKVQSYNHDQILLKSVYYLQTLDNASTTNTNQNTNTNSPKISLIKLGSEVHAPQDQMYIYKDQIVFIEDLKPDSQVVKAILGNK